MAQLVFVLWIALACVCNFNNCALVQLQSKAKSLDLPSFGIKGLELTILGDSSLKIGKPVLEADLATCVWI